MRPGQLELNEFEIALIQQIASDNPQYDAALRAILPHLRMAKREFTGVGSFTHLYCPSTVFDLGITRLCLELHGTITIPGLKHGLGAVLFCDLYKPEVLETYLIQPDDHWDGVYEGFHLQPPSQGS